MAEAGERVLGPPERANSGFEPSVSRASFPIMASSARQVRRGKVDLAGALPGGMSEEALISAIVTSGYPLQTVVASALKKRGFTIIEEWAYQDPEHDVRRSMDILASRPLAKRLHRTEAGESSLTLTLVVECKQSQSPYVLFESVDPMERDQFPFLSGLGDGMIELAPEYGWTDLPHMKWDKAPFKREISVQTFLQTVDDEFVVGAPVVSSLSKATAGGKHVRLSGEEPYNALMLPLTKATAIYRASLDPYRNAGTVTDVQAVIPLAVLDAPMILVGKFGRKIEPEIVPWVRAVIRRPLGQKPWWDPLDYDIVDIVHSSFVNRYLDKHALPYMRRLWNLQKQHHDECLGGKVFVHGLSPEGPVGSDLLERLVATP